MSTSWSSNLAVNRPSSGTRRSATSMSERILILTTMASWKRLGGVVRVVEDAVDPVAHDYLLLERLDVNVGRALGDGLPQDEVHQLDDRGVLGPVPQFLFAELLESSRVVDAQFDPRALDDVLEVLARPSRCGRPL